MYLDGFELFLTVQYSHGFMKNRFILIERGQIHYMTTLWLDKI